MKSDYEMDQSLFSTTQLEFSTINDRRILEDSCESPAVSNFSANYLDDSRENTCSDDKESID